jgi:hypothetical protein
MSYSEWKTLILFQTESGNVIRIQIEAEPDKNDDGKGDETCAVVDCCDKREQENPEDGVIGHPNQGKWVSASLLNCNMFRGGFS